MPARLAEKAARSRSPSGQETDTSPPERASELEEAEGAVRAAAAVASAYRQQTAAMRRARDDTRAVLAVQGLPVAPIATQPVPPPPSSSMPPPPLPPPLPPPPPHAPPQPPAASPPLPLTRTSISAAGKLGARSVLRRWRLLSVRDGLLSAFQRLPPRLQACGRALALWARYADAAMRASAAAGAAAFVRRRSVLRSHLHALAQHCLDARRQEVQRQEQRDRLRDRLMARSPLPAAEESSLGMMDSSSSSRRRGG